MILELKNELCFIDFETTGLNIMRDRIIQIGILKYSPNQDAPKEWNSLVNPGVPISEESVRVTGITVDDVRNKPTFAQIAEDLYDFIGMSDIAGYNSNRFDIPILMEEFNRVGIDFNLADRKLIDVQQIFYKMEPRTLAAAHKYYTGQEMEGAHDALADVKATVAVLEGQLKMYKDRDFVNQSGETLERPVRNDIHSLSEFSRIEGMVDVTQRLKKAPNGKIIFNFGKYKGKSVVEIFKKDTQYYNWIMNKEFSVQTKKIVKEIYTNEVLGSDTH